MYNPRYLSLPLIYVKDNFDGHVHVVGTNSHDRLFIDEYGHIQYMNLQNGCTTQFGDYTFVFDKDGKTVNDILKKYKDLINDDIYFDMLDIYEYANDTIKKKYEEDEKIIKRHIQKISMLK